MIRNIVFRLASATVPPLPSPPLPFPSLPFAYVRRTSVSAPFFSSRVCSRFISRRIGQFFGGHVCGWYPRIAPQRREEGKGVEIAWLKSVREWDETVSIHVVRGSRENWIILEEGKKGEERGGRGRKRCDVEISRGLMRSRWG